MSIYHSSPGINPDEVIVRQAIYGRCHSPACSGRANTATRTVYRNGEEVVRCDHCRKAGFFTEGNEEYNNPAKHRPFRDDEDSSPPSTWDSRYSRGLR